MDSFVNIEGTGNLLVLKTLPGNAQSIGAILDQIDWDEVLELFVVMIPVY